MRVLVLCPQLPWPPQQGTTLRNFNLLRGIAARHRVTLATFAAPGADPGPLADWGLEILTAPPPPPRPIARRLLDLPSTATPDLARRLGSEAMDRLLADWVGRVDPRSERAGGAGAFDVVQIEGLEMAAHGLAVWELMGRRPRLIYDAHNAEWLLQDRVWRSDLRRPRGWVGALYSIAQTAKLARFEGRLLAACDAAVAVSVADAAALRRLRAGIRIAVVPNGVDTQAYVPADPAAVDPALCVFTGKMDFRPNIDAVRWFAQAVWPRVRAARPGARFAVVGRDPGPGLLALAGGDSGIEVTGGVPDVRPWIAHAALVAVPLRMGGGTRLKVLEAMAMAKAIAATSFGVEGLDLRPGEEALVADAPEDLAAAILRLMADPDLRSRLGAAARARAVADYRWERLVPAIEALYGAD